MDEGHWVLRLIGQGTWRALKQISKKDLRNRSHIFDIKVFEVPSI
jgi:hypothetical protein